MPGVVHAPAVADYIAGGGGVLVVALHRMAPMDHQAAAVIAAAVLGLGSWQLACQMDQRPLMHHAVHVTGGQQETVYGGYAVVPADCLC